MEGTVAQTQPQDERPQDEGRLVYRGLTVPFILLAVCFAVWGCAANLTDVMVGVFKHIFVISNAQSALIQTAYYGAYFTLAIPAAFINRRFGYKAGVLTGLGVAAVGGALFFPASKLLAFAPLCFALFVLAAGLSILETSANPFMIAMGPEDSATQRLNLAQAFNPIGANIGVLLGALLILPSVTTPAKTLTAPQLHQAKAKDLSLVVGPYLGIAVVLLLMGLLIAFRKMPTPTEQSQDDGQAGGGAL